MLKTDKNLKAEEDLTGQSRFAWNLMVSWVSQLALIFSGFIMPRVVDEKIGQVALGIWDFGWTFVGYLTLLGFGMGACFNRYIAKYRASNEIDKLNEVANSVVFIQIGIATFVTGVTLLFFFILPVYFSTSLQGFESQAQWVILFLGFSLTLQMLSGSARGLLTGYHRWDIHNALHAGSSLLSLLLMLCSLFYTDMGVVGMALSYFIATLIFESLRFYFVRRVCHEFHFNLRLAKRKVGLQMFTFSLKSMLANLPPILLLQSINLMIVTVLGPAALAIFARPMALTRHINTFMSKFTLMLTPTTGALEVNQDMTHIQDLYLYSTRLSFAFSLPLLAFLFTYGDVLLTFWMGSDYALWSLMMVLSIGQVLSIAQDTSIRILMGLDQHGKISIYAFLTVLFIFIILFFFFASSHWTLTKAAICFVVPLTCVYGFMIPIYTCRKLALSYFKYCQRCFFLPLLYLLPYLVALSCSRILFDQGEVLFACLLFAVSVALTLLIYFIYLVPRSLKQKLYLKLGLKSR